MNLLEAIQGAGENWFRPVGDFPGKAYRKDSDSGLIFAMYRLQGESSKFIWGSGEINGEWEIVTPEQVLSERKL